MKNTKLFSALLSAGLLAGATGFTSCDEDEDGNSFWGSLVDVLFGGHEYTQNAGDNYFGWFAQDEDTENIEDDINLVSSSERLTSLPTKTDLTKYLPPIGNQGQYGTCVGWAVGYNCRTFLYAKSKGLSKSQLSSTSNQFSPKDLFWSIKDSYKGSNCNGTNFEYAFDVMIQRGIARLSTVPYSNLGSCTYNPTQTGGSDEAPSYKIKNYREIQVDKATIKKYLAEGRLVVFGAKLGDEFMNANSPDVLYRQSYGYTGMHAYHAMVCSGYDDSKGSNGAFRVVNSWGTNWGDDGYIWVDQDFFVGGDFAYCAFVAYDLDENTPSDPEIDEDDNTVVDVTSGHDLIPLNLSDYQDPTETDPLWREASYNVYNAGEETIPSSKNWAICYLWYNAKNANDYDILLFDFYTDMYGSKGQKNWDWTPSQALSDLGVSAQGCAWQNFDIPGGKSVAEVVKDENKEAFYFPYKMPEKLNGEYYLVLIADAFGGVEESDEENNYLFCTDEPIKITNGIVQGSISKMMRGYSSDSKLSKNQKSALQSVVNTKNANTYTPEEIYRMINNHKKTGALAKKAMQWRNSADGQEVLAKAKR